jgi:4-hydroxy-tetrahydrodipicolinate synthase
VEKLPVIPAVKAVIAEHSGDPGWAAVRPPLVALAQDQRDALLAALKARGFEMPGLRAG